MSIKTNDSTQLSAVQTLRTAIRERRLPAKSDAEWLIAQLDAIEARLLRSADATAKRERERQVRDFDGIMGDDR